MYKILSVFERLLYVSNNIIYQNFVCCCGLYSQTSFSFSKFMCHPFLLFWMSELRLLSYSISKQLYTFICTDTKPTDFLLYLYIIKCYIWGMALYGAETWTLPAADQKYLESFEMWCWRRMEKISWTDHVRNEEVLFRVNEQRNILHEIRKRKANWIGHILRRNCLLK